MKAVVVLSGGQDSATALALAVRRHGADEVAAITFSYGQRHSAEVKCAESMARHFGIALHKVVRMDFFGAITQSALLDRKAVISRKRGAACPNTVVEGRNGFFLLAASVFAKGLGATEVHMGVSEEDFSGYPDCRGAFLRAAERAVRLALDYPVKVVAPFLHKTKAEEWAIADRLGIMDVIDGMTVTCYNGVPGAGCGKCPACRLRRRGRREYMAAKKKGLLP